MHSSSINGSSQQYLSSIEICSQERKSNEKSQSDITLNPRNNVSQCKTQFVVLIPKGMQLEQR